ncbi:uncharacterized protein LOC112603978 [Melanaphis sacchari]|uniref:uncharacterized protein LOC112603978 n=1 Tax=Melanaphis sacchari TaxID=742174 RepID=UPI000DC1336B|nr:uncharacterized protein LOC112603978 [Melanaphis sacchari]
MTDIQKISWVVAYFTRSYEYGIIPMNWLIEKNDVNENGTYCLWPPNPNITSEDIIRASPPDSSWLICRVKIIVNKPYDDYVRAWHELFIIVESSSTKTKSILKKMIDNKKINLTKTKNVGIRNNAYSSSQPVENINMSYDDGMTTIQEPLMMNTPKSTDIQIDNNPITLTDLDIKNILNAIYNNGINIKFMLSGLLSNLEGLKTLFDKMELLQLNKYADVQFPNKFPINSSDELKCIEECILLNKFDFRPKLEIYIKTIGGHSFKNHVVRALSRLITDEYAVKCTWTGRGKGKSTKISDKCLIMILKKVVQECYSPQINTDFEFEKIVAGWLKCVVTRYNKTKAKTLSPIP